MLHGNRFLPGAIIGDGDWNELSFTISRATPMWSDVKYVSGVRFGLFLAQIAPSLQN